MASERGDVRFVQHSMYYPVTDAAMDTDSYDQFAEGYFLAAKGMAWFWDAYLPHWERRGEITASPLQATLEELTGLPEAFVIVDENDVLRDEGEAYAARLRAAGVAVTTVRYDGITHDFMMLTPPAARTPPAPPSHRRSRCFATLRSADEGRTHCRKTGGAPFMSPATKWSERRRHDCEECSRRDGQGSPVDRSVGVNRRCGQLSGTGMSARCRSSRTTG
jgi:hypothetical protein